MLHSIVNVINLKPNRARVPRPDHVMFAKLMSSKRKVCDYPERGRADPTAFGFWAYPIERHDMDSLENCLVEFIIWLHVQHRSSDVAL